MTPNVDNFFLYELRIFTFFFKCIDYDSNFE